MALTCLSASDGIAKKSLLGCDDVDLLAEIVLQRKVLRQRKAKSVKIVDGVGKIARLCSK